MPYMASIEDIVKFMRQNPKGVSFKDLVLKVGDSTVKYGNFIQSAFDFFVIALVVFLLVRAYEKRRGETAKTGA